MTLGRKDVAATALTALAVLVYIGSRQSWNVWLVGGSHRSAAGAIMLLGIATCTLGQAGAEMAKHPATMLLAIVGTLSLAVGVWAVVTGSLTALTLLTAMFVVLWAGSTLRHAWRPTHGPIAV
ncbi:MAG TPA: hypothetical protein VEH79_04900 [Gaiellaceae bacterium]|nr:hypothetical protein [Gaiellaceae bacterium]